MSSWQSSSKPPPSSQQQQQHYRPQYGGFVPLAPPSQAPHYTHHEAPAAMGNPAAAAAASSSSHPMSGNHAFQVPMLPPHVVHTPIGRSLPPTSGMLGTPPSPRSNGATGSSAYSSPVGPDENNPLQGNSNQQSLGPSPLRRGQACQACRRRKLKCDAIRPVCSTCTRSRKAAAAANHPPPVPDGDCVYDDAQVSAAAPLSAPQPSSDSHRPPMSKVRRPSHLNGTLLGTFDNPAADDVPGQKRRKTMDGSERPFAKSETRSPADWDRREESIHHSADIQPAFLHTIPGESAAERAQRLETYISHLQSQLKQAQQKADVEAVDTEGKLPKRYPGGPAVPIFSMLSPSSGREEKYRLQYLQRPARHIEGPGSTQSGSTYSYEKSDSLFDIASGSNDDTFREQRIRSELADWPSAQEDAFLQLLWPGWSVDLPSPDTVHSICEIFFRLHPMRGLVYKPSFMSGLSLPAKHPHRPHDSLIHAILATTADISPYFDVRGQKNQDRFVMLLSDSRVRNADRSELSSEHISFKEFHLRKAREKVEQSLLTEFRNPLDWIAAMLIACYTVWSEFRILEAYFLSAILCRAVSPAGLDKLPSRHLDDGSDSPVAPGLFGSPEGIEEQERRMALWHVFIADQYTAGTPLFHETLLAEESLLTHLPCAVADFQAGKDVPPNTQTLSSPDLFRTGHTDDFTLHIKSAVLVRRACTLHSRNQLTKKKPAGLNAIDRQITEFSNSFPLFDYDNKEHISVDKVTAYTNIWYALINLHEPYLATATAITVKEAKTSAHYSVSRVNLAVENILGTIHYLMNSSFDFAILHPHVFLTWSVCGRMLGKDLDLFKRKGAGSETSLQQVVEKLQWIILALERGGQKSTRARRCSELVSYVRSGILHESILSQLLFTDGVIPSGDEDLSSTDPSQDTLTAQATLDALLMSTAGHGSQSSPELAGFSHGFGAAASVGQHEQQAHQSNELLLPFAM